LILSRRTLSAGYQGCQGSAPPGAIEARDFFRQRIKRRGPREKTLFPNESSNYQFGGQFAAVQASSSIGRAKKDWAATCRRNGLPKPLLP